MSNCYYNNNYDINKPVLLKVGKTDKKQYPKTYTDRNEY